MSEKLANIDNSTPERQSSLYSADKEKIASPAGHFYENVRRLGNVAVSRHAQARMASDGILRETFESVLLNPPRPDRADGMDVLWREGRGIRIVILTNPTPNVGAKLVKTVYRVQEQAKAKR